MAARSKPKSRFTAPLGPLESQVMGIIWSSGPLSVRDVGARFAGEPPAYTTVMTTLDRLYKKGLVLREKTGAAFIYEQACTQAEYQEGVVGATVNALFAGSVDPVLAAFVDAAAKVDEKNLARLEKLIAKRRRGER
jgi:predicted transcriptional regulator